MAHFDIISSQGQHPVIWSGAPKYVGAYLKPGYLEFPAIGSPTPLSWHVGDYVVYSRTGKTYRLYRTPQAVEQGLSNKYGASFLYENVQFFDDSKQLEFCPFTDLVPGDNTVHFSTQNVVSFFGKPANVAERIQACLEAQYGAGTWEVRVVTTSDADLLEILNTEIEFSVTGANCQEVLDKVYEQWNGLGWIHTVENGKNVITIGASNVRTNANTTVPFAFDNGLVRVERSISNADQIGTRLFAYGSMKNMDATYYRGLDIKDAESVDIEHLMIPIANWGITDGKPDARKAYIENATAIASLGLIPKTAYFDGSGDLPDIHPTIERMTIGEVYDAGGAGYVPDLSKWSRSDRIDELVSAVNPSDHGTSADQGQKYIETLTGNVAAVTRGFSPDEEVSIGIYYATVVHAGNASLRFGQNSQALQIIGSWTPAFNLSILISAENIKKEIPIVPTQVSSSEWSFILPESVSFGKVSAGATISVSIVGFVSGSASSSDAVALVTDSGTSAETSVEHEIDKTFTVRIPQIGFDIEKYAELGNGKILSMKTGMCGARDFEIKDVRYVASADAWDLTLYRSVDEGLNIMFPNADYQIASGDQFVLLDIAMPEMYVTVASSRLLAAAQKLLADISSEKPFYNPQVDAKVVYNEGRILREGMWMDITQEGDQAYCLIDSITIDENGSNIPTYEVALREKKGIDWTENVGKSGSSKSSVSVKGGEEVKTNGTVTSVGMTAPTGLEVEGSPITGTGVLKLKLASGYKIPLESELAPYFEQDDQIATLVKLKAAFSYLGPKKGLIFDSVLENDTSDADLYVKWVGEGTNRQRVLYSPLALITGGDQIVGDGTPGGGGTGGANYLYELNDVFHKYGSPEVDYNAVLRATSVWATSTPETAQNDDLLIKTSNGWAAIPKTNVGVSTDATTSAHGLMSAADKTKLDSIAFGTAGSDYVPITIGSTTKNVLTSHQSLSAYLTSAVAAQTYQPLDADLTAIAALTGPSSGSAFLKRNSGNTWSLDTNTYLTGNQTITLSGDVSGSGTTSIAVSIGAGKVTNTMLANSAITINGSSTSLGGSFNTASITAGTAGTSSATSGYTLAVPYVTMNKYGIVTGYGTHTHTVNNIPNSSLVNSSITVGSTAISLGGAATSIAGLVNVTMSGKLKIGDATIEWVAGTGGAAGYLKIDQALLTSGDQIVGSGTPGGGGSGEASYVYELKDTISGWTANSGVVSNGQVLMFDTSAIPKNGSGGAWRYGSIQDMSGFGTYVYSAQLSRNANTILAAPNGSSGVATFRSLVANDIPSLAISKITGLQTALDGKASTSALGDYLPLTGGTLDGSSSYPLTIKTSSPNNILQLYSAENLVASFAWQSGTYGVYMQNIAVSGNPYVNIASDGVFKYNNTYPFYHSGNLTKSVLTGLLDASGGYYLPLTGGKIESGNAWPLEISDSRTSSAGFTGIMYSRGGTNLGILGMSDVNTPVFVNSARTSVYVLWHAGNSNKSNADWICEDLTANGSVTIYESASHTYRINANFSGAIARFYAVANDASAFNDLMIGSTTVANSLYYQASTNRFGIGTNGPGAKLEISYSEWAALQLTRPAVATAVFGLSNTGLTIYQSSSSSTSVYINLNNAYGVGINKAATSGYGLDVSGAVRTDNAFVSSVATGTAPLTVSSTTLVSNFNADYLDGQHGSYYATASSVTTLQGYFTNGSANSAIKLNTARSLWGNSFDGTADISGSITITKASDPSIGFHITNGAWYSVGLDGYGFYIYDVNNTASRVRVDSSGNTTVYGNLTTLGGGVTLYDSASKNYRWNINFSGTTGRFYAINEAGTAYNNILINNTITCTSGYAVGIGTTSPGAKLDVAGQAAFLSGYFSNSDPSLGGLATGTVRINASTSSGGKTNYGLYSWVDFSTGNAKIQVGREDSLTATYALCLQPLGGNVGIGTSSPGYKLGVAGDASVKGYMYYENATSVEYSARIGFNGSVFYIAAPYNSGRIPINIGWRNDSTPAIYCDANGRVGIGTPSPSQKLHVAGTILSTGDQVISSDERLKTNIKPVELTVEQIAGMRAVTYDRKDSGLHSLGVIAQDWEKVLPESVNQGDYLTFKYAQTAMVSAIVLAKHETEQDKEIKKLKNRVKELENEVKRLRS